MSSNAARLMTRAAELMKEAATLLAAGRVRESESRAREADRLRERAFRQARTSPETEARPSRASAQSDRHTIVEGLTELDAVASPRLLSDYLVARFGRPFSPRQFSSVRRDERAAWKRPSSRTAFIVPALEGKFLTPARGLLAISTWATWRRIIGPRTERVELLRAARNVLAQWEWLLGSDAGAGTRMAHLLVTLVRTIPGALEDWAVTNADRTRTAIDRELAVLQEADKEWRVRAAERAESQLDEGALLWGVRPPHLVRTGGSRP